MKLCPLCKSEFADEFFFCENDGNKLEEKPDASSDLNIGDKNIHLTPCFSFILISFKLCADPIISRLSLLISFKELLNEGIYIPSNFSFFAILRLFEM